MRARWLLFPLNPVYRLGLALRDRRLVSGKEPVRRLRHPVISIGNLSTGGAGKTPMTIALARGLRSRGIHVDVLSRGYGRRDLKPARVRMEGTAREFGDEPLLIARQAGVPVYVASQRYDAGLLAESDLAPEQEAVHLLDDGFQHRQLFRDIDIVLLSRTDLHDRLLPAGNLREPLQALRRADALAIPGGETEIEPALLSFTSAPQRPGVPVWRLRRSMEVPVTTGPVVAFCGIAKPDQFFAGLQAQGHVLAARRAFRDHHNYTQSDLDRLALLARASGADCLLTTDKDAVRLAGLRAVLPVQVATVRVEIENESTALDWLVSRLQETRRGK